MLRSAAMVTATALLLTGSSYAAKPTAKDKCLRSVLDIAEMRDSEDTPKIGEKAQQDVDDLVEVAAHLCQQGNFQYAERLLEMARGMLVSE